MSETTPKTVKLLDGHVVMVAEKSADGRALRIELLLNSDDLYGTVTRHGTLYKPTRDELFKHLRWVFDVEAVEVVKTTLVY